MMKPRPFSPLFRRLAVVVAISGVTAVSLWAQQRADVERVRKQLIGSYKLISYVSYDEKGVATKLPYSVGQISYDAAGRMSAQLMRDPNAPPTGGAQPAQSTAGSQPGQQGQAPGRGRGQGQSTGGYVAYFGRYEIEPEKSVVYHVVEGSISANMLGQRMPRYYEFSPDGATLFLQTKNAEGRVTGRLQWDRYR